MKRTNGLIGPQYSGQVWLWTDKIEMSDNGSSVIDTKADLVAEPVRLENKVALIVGGASEKGKALAISFAERGIDVAIVYYEGRGELARQIKEKVEQLQRRCVLICGDHGSDLDNELFAQRAVEQVLTMLGHLDIYINLSTKPFSFGHVYDVEPQQRMLTTRVLPHFPLIKAALDKIIG